MKWNDQKKSRWLQVNELPLAERVVIQEAHSTLNPQEYKKKIWPYPPTALPPSFAMPEHDRVDLSLIIAVPQVSQPLKHSRGFDYPITATRLYNSGIRKGYFHIQLNLLNPDGNAPTPAKRVNAHPNHDTAQSRKSCVNFDKIESLTITRYDYTERYPETLLNKQKYNVERIT